MGYIHEEEQVRLLRAILQVLNWLYREITHQEEVASFAIEQQGDSTMAILGIIPGKTGVFVATPLDANGNSTTLPAGVVPTWTSSDTVNAPVTVSPDGLTATVITPTSAPTTESFTLTVTGTITAADGTVTTPTGTATVPFDVAPAAAVASFGIGQTS